MYSAYLTIMGSTKFLYAPEAQIAERLSADESAFRDASSPQNGMQVDVEVGDGGSEADGERRASAAWDGLEQSRAIETTFPYDDLFVTNSQLSYADSAYSELATDADLSSNSLVDGETWEALDLPVVSSSRNLPAEEAGRLASRRSTHANRWGRMSKPLAAAGVIMAAFLIAALLKLKVSVDQPQSPEENALNEQVPAEAVSAEEVERDKERALDELERLLESLDAD
ncbi:hypothetical protein Efla_004235 [Eimeria flavescens]